VHITYDPDADALYIELRPLHGEDSQELEPGVTAIFDGRGHVTGIEIPDAKKRLGTANVSYELLTEDDEEPATVPP
jgi:uncharacterized protein YuzE